MRTRFLISAFFVSAALLLSAPAFAQTYGPSGGGERAPQDVKAAAAAQDSISRQAAG